MEERDKVQTFAEEPLTLVAPGKCRVSFLQLYGLCYTYHSKGGPTPKSSWLTQTRFNEEKRGRQRRWEERCGERDRERIWRRWVSRDVGMDLGWRMNTKTFSKIIKLLCLNEKQDNCNNVDRCLFPMFQQMLMSLCLLFLEYLSFHHSLFQTQSPWVVAMFTKLRT